MKQDLRVSVTKRMVKESLLQLLRTKQLDSITVSELCKAAQINRATFYRHYDTLYDVLHEIEVDFFGQAPQPEKPPKTAKDMHQHMEAVCTYIYQHADTLKLLFLNKSATEMLEGIDVFYRDFLTLRKKELPIEVPDEDTLQIVVALLGGGGQCVLRKWIMEDIPKTPAQIATILCNVIRWPVSSDFFLQEIN